MLKLHHIFNYCLCEIPVVIKLRSKITRKVLLVSLSIVLLLGIAFWNCLPAPLFNEPFSTVLLDRDGKLLSAAIAEDEQWRFPPVSEVPGKFRAAILCAEDKRFYAHPGIDPLAVGRAFWLNIRDGRIVSGASTITMQVIRIARKGQRRTIQEKLIEMILTLRLELAADKEDILKLYASYAPFGGNVVGLEAASWRYFGREPDKLSWAESAMLAVLPNNPALVHPGKNRERLLEKRNILLEKMQQRGLLDELSVKLAKQEPLPPKPHPIPMLAPHLLTRIRQQKDFPASSHVRTTLDKTLHVQSAEILRRHQQKLAGNQIHNIAALILDVDSGKVLAYHGNAPDLGSGEHGNYVDIITAPRSTGSLLKPFLYAGMLDSGELLPSQLVADIPTRIGAFSPENYSRSYQGAVPAYRALARSLNIPAVRLLRSYTVDRFSTLLKKSGMSTLHRPANEYGLTLILGGAEGTLWELTGIYAGMARLLNNYSNPQPDRSAFFPPKFLDGGHLKGGLHLHSTDGKKVESTLKVDSTASNPFSAAAVWLTFEAMLEVARPEEDSAWEYFSSSRKIAWKTGTSYGYRDAWSIGVTPRYAVGVWVGNADGEGRPGLTGLTAAAPVLFDLFGLLDGYEWFAPPEADLPEIEICAKSGYLAGPNCAHTKKIRSTKAGLTSQQCPYCKLIHADANLEWRVHSDCERVAEIRTEKWFVLPPALEWHYIRNHSDYLPLPPYRDKCVTSIAGAATQTMSLIYPDAQGKIYVPVELDGSRGRTVFEAAHRDPRSTIFWHLDEEYLGETRDIHQVALNPSPGKHTLTLVDEQGEYLERRFTVLTK